ncbi:MAG TPA: hypothetical protein VL572_03245 [Pyrinomonadaceae bacterium]|nr:hypothetical protein [Pyrinomonadaceae bacterium]
MLAKRLFIHSIVGLFLFTFVAGVNAQSSDDRWRALNDLKPGTRIVVDQDGGRSVKAKFASSIDQKLAVMVKGKRIEIDRSTILAVYLGRKSSKVKRGLIGALAGAGAGMLIGAATVAATKGDGLIAAGGFLYGIPIGAAIGVATAGGTKKGELLYSR